jgi:SAM-dependent methyltransferase
MSRRLGERRAVTDSTAEGWQPPHCLPASSGTQRVVVLLRRFVDLQAGSIWSDLAAELPHCQGVVLDAGCGAQPYRSLLSPDVSYVGIDSSSAKDHFGYETPGALYYSGSTWPFEDGGADVVLCTETLEHVDDPQGFLAEASRCLTPRGRILLTVPFAARWHYIPHDYWRFTPSALRQLLSKARFENVAIYARGNSLTVACYKTMALILHLLVALPGRPLVSAGRRLLALLLSPVLLVLAVIGNLSLRAPGGDDCLGYTVVAERATP